MSDLIFGTFGEELLELIQSFSNLILDFYFSIMTILGAPLPVLIIIVLLYYTINKDFIAKLAYVLVLSVHLNLVTKAFFHNLRPYQYDPRFQVTTDLGVDITWVEKGYSFPSGHSQSQGTIWGYIFSRYRNASYLVVGFICMISIPLSRSYLGVHWPSDILIGLLFGLFISFMFVQFEQKYGQQVAELNDSRKIILGFVLSFGLLILGIFMLILGSSLDFNNAISLTDHLVWKDTELGKYPGILAGLIVGQICEKRYVNFEYKGKKRRIILLRIILGVVSAIGLYLGTKLFTGLFEEIQQTSLLWILIVVEYISYFIIVFSLVVIVPWLFVEIEAKFFQ